MKTSLPVLIRKLQPYFILALILTSEQPKEALVRLLV